MATKEGTRRAHEVLADRIRGQIVRGELIEGQRLPSEDVLTVELGTSRTTLREALRVLESQGLIVVRRGRGGGPEVTHPNLEPMATALAVTLRLHNVSIGDLDAARRMIEPQIAGHLARCHDDDDIAALEAAVADARLAADRDDVRSFAHRATRVHETLLERSGNTTLATISELLQGMVRGYYLRSIPHVDQREMNRAVRSYERFVGYIRDGDDEAAIAHWHAVMSDTLSGRDPDEVVTVAAEE